MTAEEKSPTDQLVELLVYAPVGLIYEYQNVMDQVVKRGRSQVQLAKLIAKMAAQRGQSEVEDNLGEVLGAAAMTVAKGITEIGAAIGLAPPATTSDPTGVDSSQRDGNEPVATPVDDKPLPIARYDELTAKEIIPLLPDLDRDQRDRVRTHEASHRNRKTVLAKLDQLA